MSAFEKFKKQQRNLQKVGACTDFCFVSKTPPKNIYLISVFTTFNKQQAKTEHFGACADFFFQVKPSKTNICTDQKPKYKQHVC